MVAKRTGLALIFALLLGVATIIFVGVYVRANTWPCGRFDRWSGCVRSVKLDVGAVGLEPGARASYRALDLSAGGESVLVGLRGTRADGAQPATHHAVLALFDTRDGSVIQVLRDLEGNEQRRYDDDWGATAIEEAALSQDGSLVASYAFGKNENSLIVQRTNGRVVTTVFEIDSDEAYGCTAMLEFSPDNQVLQCGSRLTHLETGETTDLDVDGRYQFPFYADFAAGEVATAPDGTRAEDTIRDLFLPNDLTPAEMNARIDDYYLANTFSLRPLDAEPVTVASPLELFDARRDFVFSPDSQHLFEGYYAYREARGVRRFVPPPFRRLGAVGIWKAQNPELLTRFFTNKRFYSAAWSRDGAYVGLLNQDLSLDVFAVGTP